MFWQINFANVSQFDTVLAEEGVTLQTVMDKDYIIQETKAMSTKLMDFLTQPKIMEELVDLILNEPENELDERERYKYSNLACEILTTDVAPLTEALVANQMLLEKMASFLERDPPLNPLLASFFGKTLSMLVVRKTEVIVEFAQKHDLVSRMLRHMNTSAIMDLILKFIMATENNVKTRPSITQWLADERLVPRLVGMLSPIEDQSEKEAANSSGELCALATIEDRHSNASEILCDIVNVGREQRCYHQENAPPDALLDSIESFYNVYTETSSSVTLLTGSYFVNELQCFHTRISGNSDKWNLICRSLGIPLNEVSLAECVDEIMKQIFCLDGNGCLSTSSLVAGLQVLHTLLHFKKGGSPMAPHGIGTDPQSPTDPTGMLGPPNQTAAGGGFASHFRSENMTVKTALDEERASAVLNRVMTILRPKLNLLADLLTNPPKMSALRTTAGILDPPLGQTRLEVCRLISTLTAAHDLETHQRIAQLNILPTIMDLFYKYSWNNFLHSHMAQIVANTLTQESFKNESEEEMHPLFDQLFSECHLIERIVEAFGMSGSGGGNGTGSSVARDKPEIGYVGHLIHMANHVAALKDTSNASRLDMATSALPEEMSLRWRRFVAEVLPEINKARASSIDQAVALHGASSEEDDMAEFRTLQFHTEAALQQVFADYQMQQMTTAFAEQFGFHDDEFNDVDENISAQLQNLNKVSLQLPNDTLFRQQKAFEELCAERISDLRSPSPPPGGEEGSKKKDSDSSSSDNSDEDGDNDRMPAWLRGSATEGAATSNAAGVAAAHSSDEEDMCIESSSASNRDKMAFSSTGGENFATFVPPTVDPFSSQPPAVTAASSLNAVEWAAFDAFAATQTAAACLPNSSIATDPFLISGTASEPPPPFVANFDDAFSAAQGTTGNTVNIAPSNPFADVVTPGPGFTADFDSVFGAPSTTGLSNIDDMTLLLQASSTAAAGLQQSPDGALAISANVAKPGSVVSASEVSTLPAESASAANESPAAQDDATTMQ